MHITTFPKESNEYKRLEATAKLLSAFTSNDFYVTTTYFDFGQNWMWTTIICRTDSSEYQLLNPNDHETIVSGSYEEYTHCVKRLIDKQIEKD